MLFTWCLSSCFWWLAYVLNISLIYQKRPFLVANELFQASPKPPNVLFLMLLSTHFWRLKPFLFLSLIYWKHPFLVANDFSIVSPKPIKAITCKIFIQIKNPHAVGKNRRILDRNIVVYLCLKLIKITMGMKKNGKTFTSSKKNRETMGGSTCNHQWKLSFFHSNSQISKW